MYYHSSNLDDVNYDHKVEKVEIPCKIIQLVGIAPDEKFRHEEGKCLKCPPVPSNRTILYQL